jgi:hypothetical protein
MIVRSLVAAQLRTAEILRGLRFGIGLIDEFSRTAVLGLRISSFATFFWLRFPVQRLHFLLETLFPGVISSLHALNASVLESTVGYALAGVGRVLVL